MESDAWTLLDGLGLEGKDREITEKLLKLVDRVVVSCNEGFCVFYSTINMHANTIKQLPLTRIADTPVLVFNGKKIVTVGVLVPPYVHLVVVVSRTWGNEPA